LDSSTTESHKEELHSPTFQSLQALLTEERTKEAPLDQAHQQAEALLN